jgi:hypothetical protein
VDLSIQHRDWTSCTTSKLELLDAIISRRVNSWRIGATACRRGAELSKITATQQRPKVTRVSHSTEFREAIDPNDLNYSQSH